MLENTTKANTVSEKQSKIILMGDPQVGKTSIIQSFMESCSQKDKAAPKTDVIKDFTRIIDVVDPQ